MFIDIGQFTSYVAAVDIRDTPLPPEDVIPAEFPESAPIAVQCRLGAQLTPVDDSLGVDNDDLVLREFTPAGVITWAWSVEAQTPGDHQLRLDLEPAVTTENAEIIVQGGSSPHSATFITQVHVNVPWIQRVNQWWSENWGSVTLIGAAIGAALLSVIKWGGELGQAIRASVEKWRKNRLPK